jgi:hypothetical protein
LLTVYREKKMSEQNPTTTAANKPKYAWCVNDLPDNDLSVNEDTPCKPPPLTRMSTGAIIDGVFVTKDEMMHKMEKESDKAKEKKD